MVSRQIASLRCRETPRAGRRVPLFSSRETSVDESLKSRWRLRREELPVLLCCLLLRLSKGQVAGQQPTPNNARDSSSFRTSGIAYLVQLLCSALWYGLHICRHKPVPAQK